MFKCVREMIAGKYREFGAFKEALTDERAVTRALNGGDDFARFLDKYPTDGRALKRLAADATFFTSPQMLKMHNRADWAGVDPRIREFAARFCLAMRKLDVPLYVHGARRTPYEQLERFREGNSRVRGPVAAHTVGGAVDIVHARFHWQMGADEWAVLGKMGKRVLARMNNARPAADRFELEWGGDWGWDFAHWELKNWKAMEIIPEGLAPTYYSPHALLKLT